MARRKTTTKTKKTQGYWIRITGVEYVRPLNGGAALYQGYTDAGKPYKYVAVELDNVSQLIEGSKAVPLEKLGRIEYKLNPEFTGRPFSSWDEVYEALDEPWQPGIAAIDSLRNIIAQSVDIRKPQSRKRVARWDETDGHEMDWDRLQAGQSFWRRCHREIATGIQHIIIKVNLSVPYWVSPNDVFWPMAAAAVVADQLEEAGYAVRIIGADAADRVYAEPLSGDVCTIGCALSMIVKDYDSPLDISALTAALAGWVRRTVVFRYMAGGFGEFNVNPCFGYCMPLEMFPQTRETTDGVLTLIYDAIKMNDENDETDNYNRLIGFSREGACAWVTEQLETFSDKLDAA